ncbi:hypothetical protein MJI20_30600, partial [Salmonella enterica subsp. enterica serovar Anatum]|nr:hypothetical protein [Salmonella enterica subsp. enterica serovar Anatum]
IDTEGALLGNMILQVLESHGVKTVNKIQLGTTPVVRGAITAGALNYLLSEFESGGARSSREKVAKYQIRKRGIPKPSQAKSSAT